MCICRFMYVYLQVHVCVSAGSCMCICRFTCVYLQVHVCVSAGSCVCICRFRYVYLQVHVCVSAGSHMCICRFMYVYLQVHVCVSAGSYMCIIKMPTSFVNQLNSISHLTFKAIYVIILTKYSDAIPFFIHIFQTNIQNHNTSTTTKFKLE